MMPIDCIQKKAQLFTEALCFIWDVIYSSAGIEINLNITGVRRQAYTCTTLKIVPCTKKYHQTLGTTMTCKYNSYQTAQNSTSILPFKT
jgi:hypothetical protein